MGFIVNTSIEVYKRLKRPLTPPLRALKSNLVVVLEKRAVAVARRSNSRRESRPSFGMNALRLMHVFPSFNPGGAELRMARIMNGLGARANHAVLALNGMVGAREHIDDSVPVHFIEPPPPSRQLAYVRALRRIIAAEAPDLLLTYNWGSMEAVMASWVSGLPLVHNECGFGADEATRLKLRRVLARRVLLRRAYGVAVTANVMRETVMRRFGVPSRKVFWIRTGVDVERFRPGDGQAWRDSAGIRKRTSSSGL